MLFKVTVNDKPLKPKLHQFAWFGGTNITSKLHHMGVPVFDASADSYVALAHLPKTTVNELKHEKLAVEEEAGA